MIGKLSLSELRAESGVETLGVDAMRAVLGGMRNREGTNCRNECGSSCSETWYCCDYGTGTCCTSGGVMVCGN